jgi:hypothetical protein
MNALEEHLTLELQRQSEAIPTARGNLSRVRRSGRRRIFVRRAGVFASTVAVVVVASSPALISGTQPGSAPAGGSERPAITDSSIANPAATPLTPIEHAERLTQCLLDAGLDVTREGEGITYDNRVVETSIFEKTLEQCDQSLIEAGFVLPGDPFVAP